jgi:hypothetical protein
MADRRRAARSVADNVVGSPLPGLLLRSALVVLATLPLFWLPDNLEVGPLAPAIVLCFALATVWLVPLLGWVVIAALAYIAGAGLLNGFVLMLSLFGEGLVNPVLTGNDWAELAAAASGAGYLLWLSIAILRGRIRTGLMSNGYNT